MSQGELFSRRALALTSGTARDEHPFGARIVPRLVVAVLYELRDKLSTLLTLLESADTPEGYSGSI